MATPGAIRAGKGEVEVSLDYDQLSRGLDQAALRIRSFAAGVAKAGLAMLSAGTALAVPLLYGVKSFADYEQALANLNAQTRGGFSTQEAFNEMMANVKESVESLALATGIDPVHIVEGFTELIKAGIDIKTVLGGAGEAVLKFAHISGLSPGIAAENVAGVYFAFRHLGVSVPEIVDLISRAADSSRISMEGLMLGMGNAAASAGQYGMSMQDTVTAIAMIANTGIAGPMAGTALNTLLNRLIKRTGEAGHAMQSMGLEIYDDAGHLLPFVEIIRRIERATAGMTDQARHHLITQLSGTRAGQGINAVLAQAGSRGFLEFQAKMASGLSVSQKFAIMIDTLWGSFRRLMVGVKLVAIELGSVFAPGLRMAADSMMFVLMATRMFIRANAEWIYLGAQVILWVIGIGAALLAFGGILWMVGSAVGTIGSILYGLVWIVGTPLTIAFWALSAAVRGFGLVTLLTTMWLYAKWAVLSMLVPFFGLYTGALTVLTTAVAIAKTALWAITIPFKVVAALMSIGAVFTGVFTTAYAWLAFLLGMTNVQLALSILKWMTLGPLIGIVSLATAIYNSQVAASIINWAAWLAMLVLISPVVIMFASAWAITSAILWIWNSGLAISIFKMIAWAAVWIMLLPGIVMFGGALLLANAFMWIWNTTSAVATGIMTAMATLWTSMAIGTWLWNAAATGAIFIVTMCGALFGALHLTFAEGCFVLVGLTAATIVYYGVIAAINIVSAIWNSSLVASIILNTILYTKMLVFAAIVGLMAIKTAVMTAVWWLWNLAITKQGLLFVGMLALYGLFIAFEAIWTALLWAKKIAILAITGSWGLYAVGALIAKGATWLLSLAVTVLTAGINLLVGAIVVLLGLGLLMPFVILGEVIMWVAIAGVQAAWAAMEFGKAWSFAVEQVSNAFSTLLSDGTIFFGQLVEIAKVAMRGIVAAMGKGDWDLAWRIMVVAGKIAWIDLKTFLFIQFEEWYFALAGIWNRIKDMMQDIWRGSLFEMGNMWVVMVHDLKLKMLTGVFTPIIQAFGLLVAAAEAMLNVARNPAAALAAVNRAAEGIAALLPTDQNLADQLAERRSAHLLETQRIQRTRGTRDRELESDRNAAVDALRAERDRDIFNPLGWLSERAALQTELNELVAEANRVEGLGIFSRLGPPDQSQQRAALGEAGDTLGGKIDVLGSFSAFAAMGFSGGESQGARMERLENQQVELQRDMRRLLQQIADNGGLVF